VITLISRHRIAPRELGELPDEDQAPWPSLRDRRAAERAAAKASDDRRRGAYERSKLMLLRDARRKVAS
jgi:hypothetical protein